MNDHPGDVFRWYAGRSYRINDMPGNSVWDWTF